MQVDKIGKLWILSIISRIKKVILVIFWMEYWIVQNQWI